MIAALLLAVQIVAVGPPTTLPPTPAASGTPGPLGPAAVLKRYAAALHAVKEPPAITFDYTLDQTGPRAIAQTHRVYRSGSNERDETLTVDGKRLTTPQVRIFRGRRNRYTIARLAPRPTDYDFVFVGARRNAHHFDYVFRLTPKALRPFTVTAVTIDGVRFLPQAIDFAADQNEGAGTIVFGSNAGWWVPYTVTARAVVADDPATERFSFYTYHFPPTLPSSTFRARRLPPLPEPAKLGPAVIPPAGPRTPGR